MTMEQFFAALCRAMGWEPTPWRIAVFTFWATREGISDGSTAYKRLDFHWNPLATTWAGRRNLLVDIGSGPGKWNNANPPYGVGIYEDAEAGIDAIARTLKQDYYPNIRRCFADQVGYPEVVADFKTYVGSEAYGQAVLQFMRSNGASREPVAPPAPDPVAALQRQIDDLNRALMMRGDIRALADAPYETMVLVHRWLVKGGSVPDRGA